MSHFSSNDIRGPHQRIKTSSAKEEFLTQFLDRLWLAYRERVKYVQMYEDIVHAAGATFVNDHIAFRTLGTQQPNNGIASISRIFEALGYRPAGVYSFEEKHLNAIHYEHANREFPKLFISELKSWELAEESQKIIHEVTTKTCSGISAELLSEIHRLDEHAHNFSEISDRCANFVQKRPWSAPDSESVRSVNTESQYAAWVLLHGYNVNHFTSLVNSHGVDSLNDLESTVAVLRDAGVPLKKEIEGLPNSKLRQTSTEAVTIQVDVTENGQPAKMPWTYAYFELAERNLVRDSETGQLGRFEGFLGPQATHLFEMTKLPAKDEIGQAD